jgi:5'-3' exoribonuclease 1
MDFGSDQPECLDQLVFEYVQGLQWVLYYYYQGVPSWEWFYPYHYAPKITDLKNFSEAKFNFDIGTPFLPFQQLMGVLPAASRQHIPEPYRSLMTDGESPIIDFYPDDFECDLNGKKASWEAIVLIGFIDEKRLLAALKSMNMMSNR